MAQAHPIPTNPRFIDLTGQTFGRLTVESYAGRRRWNCRCACGRSKAIAGSSLGGRSHSCGCLRRELARARATTHGRSKTAPEYTVWAGMIQRCTNPKTSNYHDYGGRGIKVCERWLSFENFLADMGRRPSPKHSIDRFPDNDGHYEPGNCRWATRLQQNRNSRRNRKLTHDGVTICLSEWAERLGVSVQTLSSRVRAGWSVERVLRA